LESPRAALVPTPAVTDQAKPLHSPTRSPPASSSPALSEKKPTPPESPDL
jgi:hypothetical protein